MTRVCFSLKDREHPPCRAQREMDIIKASAEGTAVFLINPSEESHRSKRHIEEI